MKEIVKKFMTSKEWVCVHREVLHNDFSYARIIGCDEERFAFILISPEGFDDGIIIEDIEEIKFIEQGGPYDAKMSALMCISGYKERKVDPLQEDLILWGLKYAFDNELMVSIEVEKSGIDNIIGLVKSMEQGVCKIMQIDLYGEFDGDAYVRTDSISHLWIDSADDRRTLALYKSK